MALLPHGTNAAYWRHVMAKETACRACKDAHAAYTYRWKPAPKPLKPCGTVAAYHRHLRHGEDACRPCLDAINAVNKQRRGRSKESA